MDNKLTKQIQDFLNLTEPTIAQIQEAATLLLRINRNRQLHQSILRRPTQMLQKLQYELHKHLIYRLDGHTLVEVRQQEAKVLPEVSTALGTASRHGRRTDHEQLPQEIQDLWNKNSERYLRMKEAFATCQTLTMPCDRYEYVKLLAETYRHYRDDMARYDSYIPTTSGAHNPTTSSPQDPTKAINSARAYISKNRSRYEQLLADDSQQEEAAQTREKIAQRVQTLIQLQAAISPDLQEWLQENGFIQE